MKTTLIVTINHDRPLPTREPLPVALTNRIHGYIYSQDSGEFSVSVAYADALPVLSEPPSHDQ